MASQSNSETLELSEANWIQMAFPDQPEWEGLSDTTLIELVRDFVSEPSCAGFAIGQIAARRHCQADQWLRASALDSLLTVNPIDGLNRAMPLIDDVDMDILEDVIEALNYEHQGPLAAAIYSHPIVSMVKRKIAQRGPDQVAFSDIFASNFGTE